MNTTTMENPITILDALRRDVELAEADGRLTVLVGPDDAIVRVSTADAAAVVRDVERFGLVELGALRVRAVGG